MKRLCVFALALMFSSGPRLFAEPGTGFQSSTGTVLSSGTVTEEFFVWPVSNMIGGRRTKIVSKFGQRKAPDTLAPELHLGVDFAVPEESNVRAARSGRVLFAGFSTEYVSRKDKKEKNRLVIVLHPDGKSTRYVHLNRLRVRPGLDVQTGDVLGTSSESDEWTEPVLHFEIRESNGQPLDPMAFLTEPPPKGPVP